MFGLKSGRVGKVGSISASNKARPNFAMNFLSGPTADSRLTYTGSGGTYFDQTSTLQKAVTNTPRIDYGPVPSGVTNWIPASQTTAISLGGGNMTVTSNATIAPDGSNTAFLITDTTSTSQHFIGMFSLLNLVVGDVVTFSAYFKIAGTSTVPGMTSNGEGTATFDLVGVNATHSGTCTGATITAVGNGWFRCSSTYTKSTSNANFYLNASNSFASYLGNTSTSIYVWGPQVERGSTMGAFVSTGSGTVAVNSGATPLGMLIEETRTNSIRNPRFEGAVVGTPGTYPTNMTESHNTGLTPNVIGFGYENGIPYWDLQLSGTATAGQNNIFFENANISAGNSQIWTESAYMRVVAGSLTNVSSVVLGINDDVAGGNGTALVPSGSALGSQRFTYTRTLSATATVITNAFMQFNLAAGAVNITLRVGAPQIELGATASSPILPAIGTPAVTVRAQDVAIYTFSTVTSASRSLMVSGYKFAVTSPENVYALNSANNNQTIRSFFRNNGVEPATALEGTATTSVDQAGSYTATQFKLAVSVLGSTSLSASLNGLTPLTNTITGTTETAWNRIALGSDVGGGVGWNGYIRGFTYWARALSNAELMAVSTLDPPTVSMNFVTSPTTAIAALTTTRAAGGATYYDQTGTLQLASANTPRIDYSSIPGTYNWVHNSVLAGSVIGTWGSGGNQPTTWSVNASSGIVSSTVGSGIIGGLNYIDVRFSGTSAGTFYVTTFDLNNATLAQPGQVWTESVYMAMVGGSMANINSVNVSLRLNGAVDGLVALTSTLTRFSSTGTLGGTTTAITPAFDLLFNNGVAIDITIRFAAPQLELSPFVGPYVATSGSPAGAFATNWYLNSTTPSISGGGATNAISTDLPQLFTGTNVLKFTITSGANRGAVPISLAGGNTYTGSVYIYVPITVTTTNVNTIYFDFEGQTNADTGTSYDMSNRGVWQRISRTVTLLPNETSLTAVLRGGLTGDVFYTTAWQLERSSSASNYIPTLGTPVSVGATPLGLLVEESRVNSIRNPRAEGAIAGTPGTVPTNWGTGGNLVGSGTVVSTVVGIGVENGIPYIDWQITGTPASTGLFYNFFNESTSQIVAANGQTWTASFYCRLVAGSMANLGATLSIFGRVSGGGANEQGSLAVTPTNASLASQRRSTTFTFVNASTVFSAMALGLTNTDATTPINATFRIGAPQLELGAFATSPILPAIGTPVATTRAADALSMPFTVSAAYSISVEAMEPSINSAIMVPFQLDDNSTNRSLIYTSIGQAAYFTSTGNNIVIGSSLVAGSVFKAAGTFATNDQRGTLNGAAVTVVGLLPSLPAGLTTWRVGSAISGGQHYDGYIRKIQYWPRGLSNTELQAATT